MNEEAIRDGYNYFVSTGYNGTYDDYVALINGNENALNDTYSYFTSTGYNGGIDDFKTLMGVGTKIQEEVEVQPKTPRPKGLKEVASEVLNIKKKEDTESVSEDGSLVSQKTDQQFGFMQPPTQEELLEAKGITKSKDVLDIPTTTEVAQTLSDIDFNSLEAEEERVTYSNMDEETKRTYNNLSDEINRLQTKLDDQLKQPSNPFQEQSIANTKDQLSFNKKTRELLYNQNKPVDPILGPQDDVNWFSESVEKIVNPRLIAGEGALSGGIEETVVNQLNYTFGDYGFKFEKADYLGDGMNVYTATGEKLYIDLDNFTDANNKKESEKLKKFLYDNKRSSELAYSRDKGPIRKTKKYRDEKELQREMKMFQYETNQFQKETQDFINKRISFEEKVKEFNKKAQREGATEENILLQQEIIKEQEELTAEAKLLEEKNNDFAGRGQEIDELTAEYYNVLADRGGFFGITNSMLMEGVGEIVAGAVEIGRMLPEIIDDGLTFLSGKALQGVGYVIGEDIEMNDFNIIPSSALIDNYDYYLLEAAKEKGYKSIDELPISVRNEIDRDLRDKAIKTQLYGKKGQSNPYSQYTNQLLKDRSGGVLDNIRDGFRTALGETSTRQYDEDFQNSWLGQVYAGTIKSVPAILSLFLNPVSAGTKASTIAKRALNPKESWALIFQSQDAISQQMNTSEFENVSETEKLAVSVPIALTTATLENIGFRNMSKLKGFTNGILMRALGRTGGKQVTAKTFEEIIKNEVKSLTAKGLLTMGAMGAAEFETGLAQEFADVTVKQIYNAVKGSEMFETPESLAEYTLQLLNSGAQEAVGAQILGMPKTVSVLASKNDLKAADNATWNLFTNLNNKPTFLGLFKEHLEVEIRNKRMSAAEAKRVFETYKNTTQAYEQIPKDMSREAQKESVDLIMRRQALEESKRDKNPNLVVPIDNEIQAIDNRLKEISEQDAIQKQSTGEVDADQQATDAQAVETGTPTTESQELTGEELQDQEADAVQEVTEEEVKKEISGIVAETALPLKLETGKLGTVSKKMDQAELINEKEINEAADELYDLMDEVNNREDISENSRKKILNEIESEIRKLEAYEFETKTETRTLTKKEKVKGIRKVGTDTKRQKVIPSTLGKSKGKSVRFIGKTQKEVGGKGVLTTETRPDGKEVFIVEYPSGQKSVVNETMESPVVNKDKNGDPVSVTLTDKSGNQLTVLDADYALDEAIIQRENALGPIEENVFEQVLEEVEREVTEQQEVIKEKQATPEAVVTEEVVTEEAVEETPVAEETIDESLESLFDEIVGEPTTTEDAPIKKQKTEVESVTVNRSSDRTLSTPIKRIIGQAKRAAKSIKNIAPNVKIILHESEADYRNSVPGAQDGEAGAFNAGTNTIHINLPNAAARTSMTTVGHETFHSILFNLFNNEALTQAFSRDMLEGLKKASVKGSAIEKQLDAYIKQYKDTGQHNEEKLAEIFGYLAGNYETLDVKSKNILKRLIEKLAKILNIAKYKAKFTEDDVAMVKLMNNLSAKISEGIEITEADIPMSVSISTSEISPNIKRQLANINIKNIRAQNISGSRVGKGLKKYSQNKQTFYEDTPSLSREYVKNNAPEVYIKNANIIANEPLVKGIKDFNNITTLEQADEVYDIFVNQVADNLKYLYNNFNKDYRDVSTLWYDGANKIAQDLSKEYNVSTEQAAGIIASLSPQKDWYQNVRLAELVLSSYKDNPQLSQQMIDYQQRVNDNSIKNGPQKTYNKAVTKYKKSRTKQNKLNLEKAKKNLESRQNKLNEVISKLKKLKGKRLNEVDPSYQPYWVRLYHEINTTKDYNILRPDAKVIGKATKKDGSPSKVAWGSYSEIGKAVSIYNDGSPENITRTLGEMHKIRNFYNNIIDPMSKDGDVTIDTHAVAAGLMQPLSGNSKQVGQNFGTGTANSGALGIKGLYYAYSDAYALAAKDLNLLPRQVQSITWEAIRGLYKDTFKSQAKNVKFINEIWNNYEEGKITIDEARQQASEYAGGIDNPTWVSEIIRSESVPERIDEDGKRRRTGSRRVDESTIGRSGNIKRQLAPNGQPSNLNPEQYKLVRTPAFKKWFGDWETDPENASKVVDENGEPLVVYHGSNVPDIEIFDRSKSKRESSGLKAFGIYFSTNPTLAEVYAKTPKSEEYQKEVDKKIEVLEERLYNVRNNREYDLIREEIDVLENKGRIYPVFLNIRDMVTFDAKNEPFVSSWNNLKVDVEYKIAKGFDALEFLSPKINKEQGLDRFVEPVNGIKAENIVELDYKVDKIIDGKLRSVLPTYFDDEIRNSKDYKEFSEKYGGDAYLLFDGQPQDIKLADGSNVTFDPQQPSIKRQLGDTNKINEFVKQAKEKGATDSAIKLVLESRGVTKSVIDKIFAAKVRTKRPPSATKILGKPKPKKVTANEMTLLKEKLRAIAKETRSVGVAVNKIRKELQREIAQIGKGRKVELSPATLTKITSRINKAKLFTKEGTLNNEMIDEIVQYINEQYTTLERKKENVALNKKRKTALKNIMSGKLGVPKVITRQMQRLFAADSTLIPDSALNKYKALVESIGERTSVLTVDEVSQVERQVDSILKDLDFRTSQIDIYAEMYKDYDKKVKNADGSISYSKTIDKMVDDAELNLSTEDAALMKKFKKEILPPPEPKTKEEKQKEEEEAAIEKELFLEEIGELSIKSDKLTTRDERKVANKLNKLIKTDGVKDLSNNDLKKLIKIIDNINNGWLPHLSQIMVEKINSNNRSKIVSSAIRKAKVFSPLQQAKKLRALINSQLSPEGRRKNKIYQAVSVRSLSYIDSVIGLKGREIFKNIFDSTAKAFTNFDSDNNKVNKRIDEALNKISSVFSVGRLSLVEKSNNKIHEAKARIMTYLIQREFESNPERVGEVNPAIDYLNDTIKYERKQGNDGEADMLQNIIDKYSIEGEISLDKIYKSFNKAELNGIKVIDEVNKELTDIAEFTSGVVRGKIMSPIVDYIHMWVKQDNTKQQFEDKNSDFNSYMKGTKPSTKAKNLEERTKGSKAINFDPFGATRRGARMTLLDYHMTPVVRETNRTLRKTEDILEEDNKQTREIFRGVKAAYDQVVEDVIGRGFNSNSVWDGAIKYIAKTGYRTMLASPARMTLEFTTNLLNAAIINPLGFAKGFSVMSKLSGQEQAELLRILESKQQTRLYSDALKGRMVDTSIIESKAGIKNTKLKGEIINRASQIGSHLRKYPSGIEFIADTMITTPDKAIMRPLWLGTFSREFKKITGKEVDMDKVLAKDEAYLNKNQEALDKATEVADRDSIFSGYTDNPFMKVISGTKRADDGAIKKMYKDYNRFMLSFLLNEYETTRQSIRVLYEGGEISRIKAGQLLAATTSRMVLYTSLIGLVGNVFADFIRSMFGADMEDEEEEKDLTLSIGQGLVSTFNTLAFGASYGQLMRSIINNPYIGTEYFNEKYLTALQEGEYDPYKDAIGFSAFTKPTGEEKYKGKDPFKLFLNFLGPYSPIAKTIYKKIRISTREEEAKKEETKARRSQEELLVDMQILGHFNLIPFFKDVNKAYTREVYKDFRKAEKEIKKTSREKRTEKYLKKRKDRRKRYLDRRKRE